MFNIFTLKCFATNTEIAKIAQRLEKAYVQRQNVAWNWGWDKGVTANKHVSFGSDENVLKIVVLVLQLCKFSKIQLYTENE